MADLLKELEEQIAGVKTAMVRQNVGVIREIGDGVARVEGLSDAMLNEMLDFGQGITGLALNLEETEVGVIILGDYTHVFGFFMNWSGQQKGEGCEYHLLAIALGLVVLVNGAEPLSIDRMLAVLEAR